MTLFQAVLIVVGVGFALALINAIVAWNSVAGPKPRAMDLATPFAVRWVLYSGGVTLALAIQHLLSSLRA